MISYCGTIILFNLQKFSNQMAKYFRNNNKVISYYDRGKGQVLVLLHGYLETKDVWSSFAEKLSENYRVIALDIPGHGKSDVIAETHTMELMAESVNALLIHLQIKICSMIGHSMGGYVMLAFADLYPEKLASFILFHSSIYADNDEKKKNRLREVDFVEKGKLELIVNTNLPKTFANDNLNSFSQTIEIMKQQAVNSIPKGVCAIIRGIMQRHDRKELISNFIKPMLFIFGEKDNYIPVEVGEKMAKLNSTIQLEWLADSGHMGFVEEKEKSLNIIRDFIKNIDA